MQVRIQRGSAGAAAIRIPASKSISHRALIAAALADGDSSLNHVVRNADTEATMRVLRHLGAEIIENEDGTVLVRGVHGIGQYDGEVADCGESGSTLRFLIPLFSLTGQEVSFTGHGRLMERPLSVYEQMFRARGLSWKQENGILRIQGALMAGSYQIEGDVSSQFISGLLFALPLLTGDSVLEILPPYESRSYVTLSEDVLADAGIMVQDAGSRILIPGGQSYRPLQMSVDGDDSQAAFFLAYACMARRPLQVLGMRHDSRQGDHAIIEILSRMGAAVQPVEGGYEIAGASLHGAEIDLQDCPDLGPVLFALATQAEGQTIFRNAGRLRIKESDRIACMEEELRSLSCEIRSDRDTVFVEGPTSIQSGKTLSGHNDHRIVMALSVLAAAADGPTVIAGAEAVNKSYPEFFEDLKQIGTGVEKI
jgi:3-phosphoshikimate 1-carboxyvinyltransferase